MKQATFLFSLLLLTSMALSACGAITVNPPGEDITIVVESGEESAPPADQPADQPAEPAAPASDDGGGTTSNETMMMFLYIILALVGVAVLFAFIAAMRRPESPP